MPLEKKIYGRVDRDTPVRKRLAYMELDIVLNAPLARAMIDDARTMFGYDARWTP